MYQICLPDYEVILPRLAQLISAEYTRGSFDSAEQTFHASGKDSEEWILNGACGRLTVTFEKYEGYFFSSFTAPEPQHTVGRQLLWQTYIEAGGNPDAQEKP